MRLDDQDWLRPPGVPDAAARGSRVDVAWTCIAGGWQVAPRLPSLTVDEHVCTETRASVPSAAATVTSHGCRADMASGF